MSFDRALWRLALLAPLMAGEANAAIIRGVVMENQTGHPLARTLVTVQPVAGTNGATASLRTNMYGAFESPPLPGGAYLVSASRPGFVTSYYGQKRWNSAGVPFFLEEASSIFLDIRLKRFGAIAGTIQDENELGLSEHEVVAYLACRAAYRDRRAHDERE